MTNKKTKEELTVDATVRNVMNERVYNTLFHELITGQLEPGRALTIRGLALQLGVSPMPVREAVKRLVAQRALQMTETRRVTVAPMDAERFQEICIGRELLEPELAARALPNIAKKDIAELKNLDAAVDRAISDGNPSNYGKANWAFHSYIYEKAKLPTVYGLVENLWLQVGPFMRQVAGRAGTARMEDQHELAIKGIQLGDEKMLRLAIKQDILDGLRLIHDTEF